MPASPGSPDVAALRARLEAAEELIAGLRAAVAGLEQELAAGDAVIARQAGRIAQLERQVKRDSPGSSKPPSSDSPYKKKSRDRSLREKSGRRPGKQPGAPGATLGLSDHPDRVIECAPAACGRCGAGLAGLPAVRTDPRQVWDISPPPPPFVTQYRKVTKVCPCWHALTAGTVPAAVTGRAAYGAETRAQAANLACGHHVPVARAALLLWQMSGIAVPAGWMAGRPGRRRAGPVHRARGRAAARRAGAERG